MKDTIIFKVSYELKEQLQKEAKERDMSLSSYIKSIIAEKIQNIKNKSASGGNIKSKIINIKNIKQPIFIHLLS